MSTTVSGLTFYEEQWETGVYEGLTQATDAFNASSGGAITLTAGARKGLLPKESKFTALADLIQDRDPQGLGSLTPKRLADTEHGSVKIFHAAPLDFAAQDWEDTGLSDATGTLLWGRNYGEALAERLLNAAVSALVGGINAIGASAIHDVSGASTMDYGVLNKAAGKMGDRRQSLRTIVGYSKIYTDLSDQAFTSQQIAFQLGSATIYNGSLPTLGFQAIQTDAPPLYVAGAPDTYWTLLLQPGAISIKTGQVRQTFSLVTGTATDTPENITYRLNVEGSFELMVRNVSWTGAAKPNNAALATSGNWTPIGTSSAVKQGPGIAIKTQ